jgi:hypothetical protein
MAEYTIDPPKYPDQSPKISLPDGCCSTGVPCAPQGSDKDLAAILGQGTVECQIKPHAATLRSGKWLKPNVAAPPVSQAFGHVGSSRLVPSGAHSSPITIQQKHDQRTARVTGRFESKYLKAKADLKANIRKQLSDLKAKIVECQCGSSFVAWCMVRPGAENGMRFLENPAQKPPSALFSRTPPTTPKT